MATKDFKKGENQVVWDLFYNTKLQKALDEGKDEKKTKMCLNQYKPGLFALETLTDKKFCDLTPEDIEMTIKSRSGKNGVHMTGFFITAITEEWIAVSKELIIYLIPKEYRKMVELIA